MSQAGLQQPDCEPVEVSEVPPGTVFIVDDDAEVCRALDRLLRSASYRTRTFRSAAEFLAAYDPLRPGCIVLDFDLGTPGLDGLSLQARLNAAGNCRPIVFLSGRADIATSVEALRAGAVDFLVKPVDESRLFKAVEEALAIDAAERRLASMLDAIAQRLGTLTLREREVLEHVVRGRLNKQIAADLGTVEKTVKVHRSRVMHKMGARSLAELVQLASVAGITPALGGGDALELRAIERTASRRYASLRDRSALRFAAAEYSRSAPEASAHPPH